MDDGGGQKTGAEVAAVIARKPGRTRWVLQAENLAISVGDDRCKEEQTDNEPAPERAGQDGADDGGGAIMAIASAVRDRQSMAQVTAAKRKKPRREYRQGFSNGCGGRI